MPPGVIGGQQSEYSVTRGTLQNYDHETQGAPSGEKKIETSIWTFADIQPSTRIDRQLGPYAAKLSSHPVYCVHSTYLSPTSACSDRQSKLHRVDWLAASIGDYDGEGNKDAGKRAGLAEYSLLHLAMGRRHCKVH